MMRLLAKPSAVWSLAFCALASAMVLVGSTHQCRVRYAELQQLEMRHWALQEDYSRLLLEQSTWAAPHRVHRLAEEELGMASPGLDRHRVVGQ
jgi:cell division protein FtsL